MKAMVLTLAMAAAVLAAQSAAAQTVILVRHAEKAASPADDPPLTPAGQARARDLAARLAGAKVTLVIHSEFKRTRDTAKPTADAAHAPMKQIPAAQPDAVVAAVKAAGAAATVLVVGHSNTVPEIAKKLGDASPPQIADDDFGNLIVLQRAGTKAKVVHARY